MKAIRLTELGGPEKLHIEEIARPEPGPGELLVRLERAAFNRRDVFITQNLYPGISLPRTLGSDGAGEVAALGDGVLGPELGTPVVIDPELGWNDDPQAAQRHGNILGMPRDGTFAQYVAVPASAVFRKPKPLSYDEAAAIPLAGLTAYRAAFTRGRLSKDDVVLIPGIGGGVQTFVLLYAVHAGARAFVTTGSDEKLERALALGASGGVNYRSDPDWHKTIRKLSGGPTLVVDGTGGQTLARSLEIARTGARIVVYGATQGDATIRPFALFWRHLDLLGTSMGSPADFRAMLELFEVGGLRPVVDRVYPLEEAAAAAARVLAGEQFGKVVLRIS
ncbi:MAG: zinc-binding dehydrogenase [Vulcanimicrobiaceae bacterium]